MLQSSRRTIHVAALAAVAILTVAGCGEDVPTRAGTIDDPSATAADDNPPATDPDTEASAAAEENDLSQAGRLLTKAEAKAALPRVGMLPAGWSVDPDDTLTGPEDDNGDDVIKPKRCAVVFEAVEKMDDVKPAVKQGVTFMAAAFGPYLGVEVSSYDEQVPDTQFSTLLNALGDCPKFSVDDGTSVAKFTATSLSFPNLGEESLALRMTGSAEEFSFAMDFVAIRTGHNIVALTQMGLGGPAPIKPLKKAAQVTMRNLSAS